MEFSRKPITVDSTEVTLTTIARQVQRHLDGGLTHEDLVEWARQAMFADTMPANEVEEILDLLMDISQSTKETFRVATKHYGAFQKALHGSGPGERRSPGGIILP